MFNLLEIFIFIAGILAAVLLFQFTSELKETSDLIHRTYSQFLWFYGGTGKSNKAT